MWLYPCLPFVGSVLALVFYEYVFKKARALTEGVQDEGSEGSEQHLPEYEDDGDQP